MFEFYGADFLEVVPPEPFREKVIFMRGLHFVLFRAIILLFRYRAYHFIFGYVHERMKMQTPRFGRALEYAHIPPFMARVQVGKTFTELCAELCFRVFFVRICYRYKVRLTVHICFVPKAFLSVMQVV